MNDHDIANLINREDDPEKVTQLISKHVSGLPAERQRAIADILEKEFIDGFTESWTAENRSLVEQFLVASDPETFQRRCDKGFTAGFFQSIALMADYVAVTKGDAVNPFIPAYLKKLAAMTDEEYQNPAAHIKLLLEMPAPAPPAPPPNPFRNRW
jgi:hypothetical protein